MVEESRVCRNASKGPDARPADLRKVVDYGQTLAGDQAACGEVGDANPTL
jgi:hypothetical protein